MMFPYSSGKTSSVRANSCRESSSGTAEPAAVPLRPRAARAARGRRTSRARPAPSVRTWRRRRRRRRGVPGRRRRATCSREPKIVRRSRTSESSAARCRSVSVCADADAMKAIILTTLHAASHLERRMLRRRHGSAEPARRPQDESLAARPRHRDDVRQRRQLRSAARRARRPAAGRRPALRAGARPQRARSAQRAARAAARCRSTRGCAATPAAISCCR